jgi:hypothetical protein
MRSKRFTFSSTQTLALHPPNICFHTSQPPARGPPSSQNLPKSSPLPGNLILPGISEGFGREAGNGPSRYAPGHYADGGPHPNRFEPRGVFLDMAVERSRWACPRLTCHLVFGLAEDGIHRN